MLLDFPGGPVAENLPANAGEAGSTPIWEDPTCCGATKPMNHNYWACALQQKSQWEVRTPQLESSPHSRQLEKTHVQLPRPSVIKNNKLK